MYFRRSIRSTAAAAAVLAMVTITAPPTSAQPTTPEDPKARYERLAELAGQTDEDLLKATDDLKIKRADLEKATADLAAATEQQKVAEADQVRLRGQVDQLAAATFRGARFSKISALLTGDSPEDFLDRAAALQMLSTDNSEALDRMVTAVRSTEQGRANAADAQRRSQEATSSAERLIVEIRNRRADLDKQIVEVKRALNALPAADRAEMAKVKDNGVYLGPPGAADTALQAALDRRGAEYEWAAVGPNEFDCSGLMMWAYAKAGISLPHSSRAQFTLGRPVAMNELLPGDLVFYDDGTGNPSRIHHVGMFVGAGKMIDAPTEGQLVDIRSIRGDGHYIGARRIVG
ncbi:NlpC/P60 family protein [Actinokineospora sp. HUAS TT18]|uniref:NlpC/P60 family protein n=1 Tax=Actinokineospora sp. HUAS TT18 TaxID=3447451 RepID=UPI003F51CE75